MIDINLKFLSCFSVYPAIGSIPKVLGNLGSYYLLYFNGVEKGSLYGGFLTCKNPNAISISKINRPNPYWVISYNL